MLFSNKSNGPTPPPEIPNNDNHPKEALAHLEKVLADPTCKKALSKPALESNLAATLWREQNFEILLDGQWTSGTIDRVTIIRDSAGKALSATILDFKTDQVGNETEAQNKAKEYHSQMESYRAATAALLDLPMEQVAASLLFTALPSLVEIH